MRFQLIDRVTDATPERVVAIKNVTLAEEYLADHFPAFPVLPGVLMLEAATQAAAWATYLKVGLLNAGYDGPTVALLKSARNVRYGHFVVPGRTLTVTAEAAGEAFKVAGTVDDKPAFTGKIELSLRRAGDAEGDRRVAEALRARWKLLAPDFAA